MTFLQFALQQFIITTEGIVHGLCYNQMLKVRNPSQPAWIRVLSFWIGYSMILSISWITGKRISGYINLACCMTLSLTLMYLFYDEKLKTRVFAYMFLFLLQTVADVIVSFLYIIVQRHESANYMQDEMIGIMILVMSFASLLEFFGCWLWQRKKGIRNNGFAIAVTAMVVIFLYMIFITAGVFVSQGSFDQSFLTSAFVTFGGVGVFLLICFYYQQKQQKESQVEWENLKRIQSSQEEFFRRLEEQERKTSFIRHDHLNILGAVSQLLEEGQEEEADRFLKDYIGRLENKERKVDGVLPEADGQIIEGY